VRTARVLVILAVALAVQTTLGRFAMRGPVAVDVVLVAVVSVALSYGPVVGLLAGTAAGLVQDALVAGSIVGIGGLAKTIVGFLAGIIGSQFIVSQPLPRFVVFFGATVLHAVVFMGLYILLDVRHFGTSHEVVRQVAAQAAANAVVGVVAFELVELLPGAIERRRAGRNRIRR
jgi:rod shape-determining protein MreD